MKLAINASRARSGGAYSHLLGVINSLNNSKSLSSSVHVWADPKLLNYLPNFDWLIKHSSPSQSTYIILQMLWEFLFLKYKIRRLGCDIVINVDAGSLNQFQPSVTMSRDMLSYEPRVFKIARYSLYSKLRILFLKYIQNRSLTKSQGSVFLTQYAADLIQRDCGNCPNVSLIPHGVSNLFKNLIPKPQERLLSNKKIKCLYVSNILPYKHHGVVIKAIAYLEDKFDISLDLVGGGTPNDIRSLKLLASSECLKSNAVRFHPFVAQEELPNYLCDTDIFIFASSCENMPNILIEAMSVGLPIVCSDRGPMPEILLDGGLYFNPENYLSLASILQILISSYGLRLHLADRAKKLSENYSWDRCASELISFTQSTFNSYYG